MTQRASTLTVTTGCWKSKGCEDMKYKAKVTATWFVDVNVKFEINTFSNESDKSSEQAIDNALNLIDEAEWDVEMYEED